MQKTLLFIGIVLFVFACQSAPKGAQGGLLDAAAFQAKMDALDNEIVLDIRTPEEIALGKIGDAMELNFYDGNFDAELDKLDKHRPIMVYCKSGGRSGKTATKLQEKGFKEVYDLKGGYSGWPK